MSRSLYIHLLQAFTTRKALSEVKQIHSHINHRGLTFTTNTFLQNTIINMYDKCGSLADARKMLDRMTQPDTFSWNVVIAGYRRHEFPQEALTLFHQMQRTPVQPDQFTFSTILPACANTASLKHGLQIHGRIIRCGFRSDVIVMNSLIDMYAKSGNMQKTRHLFDKMTQRDVVSWTAIIAGYAQHELAEKALEIFEQMQLECMKPNSATFASILPACAKTGALTQGMEIHQNIIENGFWSDVVVGNALIDMYGKCGSIRKARTLFDKMHDADVVSWTAMIAGYAQNGFVEKAFETFKQMQLEGVKPNSATFASILPLCAKMGALEQGIEIHQNIINNGFLPDGVVANALIDMYAKCGSIQKAHKLFDTIPHRTMISWNAMIVGYAQNELVEKALEIFEQMQVAGEKPNSATLASTLTVCTKIGALEQGTEIHQKIIERKMLSDVVVVTALIDMYAKCGSIQKAHDLFQNMPQRDVALWTAIIAGYAQNGLVDKALEIFNQMQVTDAKLDSSTFASILSACAKLGDLEQGMEIHQKIIQCGFLSDVVVVNALLDMYAKCGSLLNTRQLFEKMPRRTVVSWNAVIIGYSLNEFVDTALEIFKNMQFAGVKPDSSTFASILPACAKLGDLEKGIEIHQKVIKSGFTSDVVVVTALVDMYAKCGSIQMAHKLYEKMPLLNVVSWTAIIAGYAQNGLLEKALEIFKQMQLGSIKPNSATFASILPAFAKIGALEQGMEIHQKIIESGFLSDVVVTTLIGMYAKCGSIQRARKLFDKVHHPDVPSWNAMIVGYAMHGYSKHAFELFELMKHSGTNADHVSFICVLFACSHAGLVDEGCKYFNQMSDSYFVMPTIDHYVCMVDLLGRAGYLEESLIVIIKMPVKPDVVVWMCLLSACKSHRKIALAEFVVRFLFESDPKKAAPYVLLSNIYAEVGRWGDVQRLRKSIKDRGIKKTPGCSWIEVHKIIHVFCVGDRSHPHTQAIYSELEKLSWEMKAAGYISDTRTALNDVEEEEKELLLCHHSEKLAIAFGLLNTSPGTTIRVVKNLRVCSDCHTATKFISKIVAREIVVRDSNRFHHFIHGQCSCEDYW